MHFLKGNYGQHAGNQAVASSSSASAGPQATAPGRSQSVGHRMLRPVVGVSDCDGGDDVEDLLCQMRSNVNVMQRARGAGEAQPEAPGASNREALRMNRSQSEATWDRPRSRPGEEEKPRAAPKPTVRGRYVFAGGNEVLAGHPSRTLPNTSSYAAPALASQFTPRTRDVSGGRRRPQPQPRGSGGSYEPPAHEAALVQELAQETVDVG
eukprot:gnl/TRDRNA2_/TRDRNA2_36263_c0_seq1.p1 gnl/TRDRNA2_/TRDRNA2_36263_c0~~gnl/TRDRNA2_/TRDRNA2_36263_c0_seq1.p1  ORF type:complete len:209 (+),score=30.64 gnl/TRDRNA2_/TRDRNA2_36263_c0_seq1:195-821(+)